MLAGRMLAERMLLERLERMRGRTLVAAALTTGMACSSQCSAQAQQASQLLAKQHADPLVDGCLVSPCLQSQEAQEQTQCKPQVDPRSLYPPLAMAQLKGSFTTHNSTTCCAIRVCASAITGPSPVVNCPASISAPLAGTHRHGIRERPAEPSEILAFTIFSLADTLIHSKPRVKGWQTLSAWARNCTKHPMVTPRSP